MSKNQQIAKEFVSLCEKYGWDFEVNNGGIVTIYKDIIPNDKDAFAKADMEYGMILSAVPASSPGSMWGTGAGAGVGALSAMKSGLFKMKKSGCNKMVCKQIQKLQKGS